MSVRIEDTATIKVEGKATTIDVRDTVQVKCHPRSYKIVGNDVYVIKRNSEPDQWFLDMINNEIETSNLADETADLDNRFTNFQDGVNMSIGYLQDQDKALAYNISTVKVSNDINTAGIQDLNITKVTAEEATAIARTTIGAWQADGEGGAWFDSQVSTISNVAYSAAKSASTLTASIDSQQSQIQAIVGDISTLEKQVDGKVETWFGLENPINTDGTIKEDVEPYKTWLEDDSVNIHTGDTYVYYELDVDGNKQILSTLRFVIDPDTGIYTWSVFTDDLASEAYQRAIAAEGVADSKTTTWYQTYAPAFNTQEDKDNATGDIWVDSDNDNKMFRYDGANWLPIDDQRIQASVERIDEVAVEENGKWTAKGSLKVGTNSTISGYVAEAGQDGSQFKVFADKFVIANNEGTAANQAPFSIDTETNDIYFNGRVTFDNIDGDTDFVTKTAMATDDGTTVINGSNIRTGHISANIINGGVIYNLGADASNYKMKIDLNNGFIHIR